MNFYHPAYIKNGKLYFESMEMHEFHTGGVSKSAKRIAVNYGAYGISRFIINENVVFVLCDKREHEFVMNELNKLVDYKDNSIRGALNLPDYLNSRIPFFERIHKDINKIALWHNFTYDFIVSKTSESLDVAIREIEKFIK